MRCRITSKYFGFTIILLLLSTLFYAGSAFSDGLGSLAKVGKSQGEMGKTLACETRSYESVRKALESGSIKIGDDSTSVQKRYGAPVVIVQQNGGTERWVYKPAYASHFDNVKIYLSFDSNGLLYDIRAINKK